MTLRSELRKMRDFLNGSRMSHKQDVSPIRDEPHETSSNIRLKSEPSRPSKIQPVKPNFPGIDGTAKRVTSGVFPAESSLLKKSIKGDDFMMKGKAKGMEDPPKIKAGGGYNLKGYGNSKVYINKTHTEPDMPTNPSHSMHAARGLSANAKELQQKLAGGAGNQRAITPVKPKSRNGSRAIMFPFEKFLDQEFALPKPKPQQTQHTQHTQPRLHSNVNLKPKRLNTLPKPNTSLEKMSTSVNYQQSEEFVLDKSKTSTKKNGVIEAYAANSNKGLVRNYNEDRVSIILNIVKPSNSAYKGEWPNCSFFGIYDGHGGSKCADFLKDKLHKFIIGNRNFPQDPERALREGFEEAELEFLEFAQSFKLVEQSGSCAIVALIIDDKCYVANVGDSRAIVSSHKGRRVLPLSKDHKPGEDGERNRILSNGGKVYQSQINAQGNRVTMSPGSITEESDIQLGPPRVLPGRLSVSRTFGDIEAKLEKFGGNPNVVIAEPEIQMVQITDQTDFIVLGCDGIFDRLENQDVNDNVWATTGQKGLDIHEQSAIGVEAIMMDSLIKQTYDNITVVLLAFAGLKDAIETTQRGDTEPEEEKNTLFYLANGAANKKSKNQRSSSNPRAKMSLQSKDSYESWDSEKSLNNPSFNDSYSGMMRYGAAAKGSNMPLAQLADGKHNPATKQLLKAYKKLNFLPLAK